VFGFDSDTPAIFNETVDFLEQAGVQNATFNILTPFPGTRLFQRLEAEGRITSHDWGSYNSRSDVVFMPRQMSSQELLAGFQAVTRRFYSLNSILKRLSRWPIMFPCAGLALWLENEQDQETFGRDTISVFNFSYATLIVSTQAAIFSGGISFCISCPGAIT
jgi:radical SAM superfamily enzyme YgiQ (UPF0313 family)